MATIKFFTRTKRKGQELATLYCRFRNGKAIDQTEKTGIVLSPDHFNNKTGNIRYKADFKDKGKISERLDNIKDHLRSEIKTIADRESLPKDWLRTAIDKFYNPDKYRPDTHNLFSFIQDFIDKAPSRTVPKTGRPVCYKQLREYERTFYYLKEYANAQGRKIDFEDINLDFYHDFMLHLQKKKLALNTIGKKIQTLKIFLNAATDAGINANRQYKSHRFTAVNEESESIYLNETELQTIYELDLTDNPKLDKVRDLFIIGCWVGLRFSDWNKITPANIDNGFLELKQAKTGGGIVIPLYPQVEAILRKYEGNLPPVISNQKFNEYLKDVAKEADLTDVVHKSITKGGVRTSTARPKHRMVTTHTARRSFATNLYKAGLPTLTIMAITGHKTEAAFLKYIKVTPREHAEKLKEFWQNRPQMKVI